MNQDELNWGMACHLASLIAFIGVPFGNLLGPLIVWMMKRETSSYVDFHGRESLNFQLSVTLYAVIGGLIGFVLMVLTLGIGAIILVPIAVLFGLAALVLSIIAAIKAKEGENYRYPFTIRFL